MDYALQNRIMRRVRQMKKQGIQFLSGTIAPADSDIDTMDIESLDKGLDYYQEKGVRITPQIKWMGSRVQMYLFEEVSQSFLVSRNGYRIPYDSTRVPEAKGLIDYWHNILFNHPHFGADISSIILDGEGMPWSLMGKGLIEKKFGAFKAAVNAELDSLDELGFEKELNYTLQTELYNEYVSGGEDKSNPRHESFSNLKRVFTEAPVVEYMKESMLRYDDQLKIYASDGGDTFYAPFNILKMVSKSGNQYIPGNPVHTYSVLSVLQQSECKKVIDRVHLYYVTKFGHEGLDGHFVNLLCRDYDPSDAEDRKILHRIYQAVCACDLEGIVLKSMVPKEYEAVHTMKVRSKDYLRIIYGPDYQGLTRLPGLVASKRTGRKRKLSHSEHRLSLEMLSLDWNSPAFDADYERIVKAILFEIEEEKTVDGRL
jgi:hypothetical protein